MKNKSDLFGCGGSLNEKGPERTYLQTHKRVAVVIAFVSFFTLGAGTFPVYNLSRQWPMFLTLFIILNGVMVYTLLGTAEVVLLPKFKGWQIFLANIVLVLLSMAVRYFLEFGEYSNTYNFTVPNMLLHVGVTVTLSTLSWLWVKTKWDKNAEREA